MPEVRYRQVGSAPEGVYAAEPGTIVRDITSHKLWVKIIGHGVDGWAAVSGGMSDDQVANVITKLGGWVDIVADYGADPNDSDFAARWVDATAEAGERKVPLYIAGGNFPVDASLVVPGGLFVLGAGKSNTTLRKAFNGDLFTVESNTWQFQNMTMEGDGANFSGGGVNVAAGFGAQAAMENVRIFNMDDPCIYWATPCGSNFRARGLDAYRYNAATGSERYAIVYDAGLHAGKYHSYEQYASHGQCAFDFGGIDGLWLADSNFADLKFDQTPSPSTNIQLRGGRWLNTVAASIRGTIIRILGCNTLPQLTLEPGCNSSTIDHSSNLGLVIDNSGSNTNRIYHIPVAYTSVPSAAGGGFSLGNGSMAATAARSGTRIIISVNMVVGSTTDFGSGALRFGLPIPSTVISTNTIQIAGKAYLLDAATSDVRTAIVNIVGGTNYATLVFDGPGGGLVGATTPWTWTTGSVIRFDAEYNL